jgi:hypothetical protein
VKLTIYVLPETAADIREASRSTGQTMGEIVDGKKYLATGNVKR